MLNDSYQAVVIGAGVNGLSLGLNLAAAGVKTLILERADRIGGQAVTEELLLPGFQFHPHANYLSYEDLLSKQPDASSQAMPRTTVLPLAQHGLAFRDGRPPVIIYQRDAIQRTKNAFSAFSGRDARAFAALKEAADKLTPALGEVYFSPPYAAGMRAYLRRIAELYAGVFEPRLLGTRSAQQLIDGSFESDEVRTLLYRLTLEFSGSLHDIGSDVAFLGYVMWVLGRRTLPYGGMGSVPAALAAAAQREGAVIACGVDVARVSTRNGVVDGVELRDGSRIAAEIVVSSADYLASVGELLSDEGLGSDETAARYAATQANMIGSYVACLDKAPFYKSAQHNADINRCNQVFIGLDSTDEVISHVLDLSAQRLPVPSGAIRMNCLWDPTQAPPGKFAAGADCPFPPGLDAELSEQVASIYPAAFANTWIDYAPNLADAFLAHRITLSSDHARKIALREGEAQYRGPVPGYYFCGASTHPGGGIHGACGVNAFKVIQRDRAL